jgi:phytoene synthase
VAEIFAGGAVRRHAVALALADAVRGHGVARAELDRLIDGRERDLDPAPFATDAELGAYARATASALAEAMAQALGAGDADGLAAARAAGEGWGRIGLLRAIPFHARQKRLTIPADLMAETKLAERDYFELRDGPALRQCAAALLKRARAALEAVPPCADRRLRPVLLLARLGRLYADAIERRRYDVLGAPVTLGRVSTIAKLWWAARRG